MSRLQRLGRLAAAAALTVSGTVVASIVATAPAGAANTNINAICSGPVAGTTINNSDTVTFTMTAGCAAVILLDAAGGSATAAGFPLSQGAPFGGLAVGDTVIFTAPASGAGTAAIGFMSNAQSPPASTYSIRFGYPPVSGSMTDNGNGSLTVTYSGTVPQSQGVVLFLAAPGTACEGPNQPSDILEPASNPPSPFRYVIDSDTFPGQPSLGSSPATVSAGTLMSTNVGPQGVAVPAGTYQACLFSYSPLNFIQGLEVTLGTVTPAPVVPTITG